MAGRYTVGDELGTGGFGAVYRARDETLRETVAIKLLRGVRVAQLGGFRREISILRLLRLPGVVPHRDDGIHEGAPFLVTDIVAGTPFPGKPAPCAWDEIADVTIGLLETVARFHAVGVVHRDLKPTNTLVAATGRLVVLDFGISWADGHQHGAGGGGYLGTPAYLAPEQGRGEACDARADIYALGVILFEALSGRLPHEEPTIARLLRAKHSSPAPPLIDFAPRVPREVSAIVGAMLESDPGRRPTSVVDVLRALPGGRATLNIGVVTTLAHLDPPIAEENLRPLFHGPDRIFHLREDGARELFARAGGDVDAIRREAAAWARAGLCFVDDDRLRIDRAALSRLRSGLVVVPKSGAAAGGPASVEAGLTELLRVGTAEQVVDEVLTSSERLRRAGGLGQAAAQLSEGLAIARRAGLADGERLLLDAYVHVALSHVVPRALDLAMYECSRAAHCTGRAERLSTLVRAIDLVRRGEGARALRELGASTAFGDVRLEAWRRIVRLDALQGSSDGDDVGAEIMQWARGTGDELVVASACGWLGGVAYSDGRYRESADLYAIAAHGRDSASGRLGAALSGAGALLDAGDFEGAETVARDARDRAREHRLAYHEARGESLVRAARIRAGRAVERDHELVDAFRSFGPRAAGGMMLTEILVAARAGDRDGACELAVEAAGPLVQFYGAASEALALAFAYSLGRSSPRAEVDRWVAAADTETLPAVGMQVLELVRRGSPAPHDFGDLPARLRERLRDTELSDQREFLALSECLRAE